MKTCALCGVTFPLRPMIDGKRRNWQRRRYCPTCSPIGRHNTKRLNTPVSKQRVFRCKCGATGPEKFNLSRRDNQCKRCKNRENIARGQKRKERARKFLGGYCMACGFSRWLEALDFHHFDSSQKDDNWKTMRGWRWEKIVHELKRVILLCRNCHVAHHAGIDIFEDRCAEAISLTGWGAVR